MGNVGDDLIATAIGDWVRQVKDDCTLTFCDFRITRPDLADFDFVIVGGGGIVYSGQFGQNETDNLANYFKIPLWARERGIPCVVLGVGVQGRPDQFSRDPLVRQFLSHSLLATSGIVVRDSPSKEVLGDLSGREITVLPDLALSFVSKHTHHRSERAGGRAKAIASIGPVFSASAFFRRPLEESAAEILMSLGVVDVRYFVMSNDDLPHRDRLLELLAASQMTCTVVDLRKLPMDQALAAFLEVSASLRHACMGEYSRSSQAFRLCRSTGVTGKQAALIKDFLPSMANSVIDEKTPLDEVLEKLRSFVTQPCAFLPTIAEVEAIGAATQGYAELLGVWLNDAEQVRPHSERERGSDNRVEHDRALSASTQGLAGALSGDSAGIGTRQALGEFDLDKARVLLNITEEIVRSAAAEPTLEMIGSQLCTASQFLSPTYQKWCDSICERPRLHRKQWEFVYVLQALRRPANWPGAAPAWGLAAARSRSRPPWWREVAASRPLTWNCRRRFNEVGRRPMSTAVAWRTCIGPACAARRPFCRTSAFGRST